MKNNSGELSLLGLTKNESLIYTYYVESGERSASRVAKFLIMDKSTVYKVSEILVQKGLMYKEFKAGKTLFIPFDIDVLKQKSDLEKIRVNKNFDNLNELIEDLKRKAKTGSSYITIEKGYDAHRKALERILECKEKLYRVKLSRSGAIYRTEEHKKFLKEVFIPKRLEKKIQINVLMQFVTDEDVLRINTTDPNIFRESRILSGEFAQKDSFKIYDDYFDITLYPEVYTDGETIISVKDIHVANMMKEVYDFIWHRSPTYYHDSQIQKRELFDGTTVPVFGLGTRGLYSRDAYGANAFRHENPFYDEFRAIDNISYNLGKGITYIDNCKSYADGLAVGLTAKALKNYPRSKIFHNCKVTKENDVPVSDMKQIEEQCDWYLKQYGTEYLDALQIHSPRSVSNKIEESIIAIEKLIEKGKVKYLSVSNFNLNELKLAVSVSKFGVATHETYLNVKEQGILNNGIFDFCNSNKIITIAARSIGLGALCGLEEDDRESENLLSILAKKYSKTSGQIALNWMLNKPNTVALIKSTNSTHINENVASTGWSMLPEEYAMLDKATL
jgi:diketogulonate reductase-like aldo/keto reductase/sugar-specific transcriptional regulator TrmB